MYESQCLAIIALGKYIGAVKYDTTDLPLPIAAHLREHLRALRRERGLTQAALGQLLGVGQARIAEIENNPGVVSVEQLMKILSALRASLVVRVESIGEPTDQESRTAPSTPSLSSVKPPRARPSREVKTPAEGQWRVQPLRGGGAHPPSSVLVTHLDGKAVSDGQALRDANPRLDVAPTSRRNFVIRPKKGSW